MIACNHCGHPMGEPEAHPGAMLGPETSFHCTNCQQIAGVRPDGSSWETLATIWPAPSSEKQHRDYAEWWGNERRFFSELMVAAGYRTPEEHEDLMRDVMLKVARYYADHPDPPGFFRRIREKVRG